MIHLRKLKLLLVLVLVVATAVGALLWIRHTTNAVRAEARERFFEQYNRQQSLMAELASHTLEEMFATFHRNLDLVVTLFEGKEVTRRRAEEVGERLKKIYGSLASTPVVDLVIFDSRGTAVAIEPADPYTVGRNYAWRDYIKWAKEKGKPGEMYLSPFTRMEGGKRRGYKALIVAEGIYGPRGEFLGVASCVLDFEKLANKHILPIRVGTHGRAWLADISSRTMLVAPSGRLVGRGFDAAFLPRWPRLYNLLISVEEGKPGSGWYDYLDAEIPDQPVRKLGSYYPFRIENRLWAMGISTPEREVDELLSTFMHRQEAFATTLLVTVLAGATLLMGVLMNWNRILSSQVNHHTKALSEAHSRLESTFDELLVAKKVAAVGHLALGLAHEIRNPLSAIQMNMQMIRKKIAPAGTLRENFSIVEEEIQRLNRLLNDVLDFARSRPLRLETAELEGIVDRLMQLMAQRLEEEQVRSEVRIDSPLNLVCDPEQIHQVLLNLVLNALDAMNRTPPDARLLTITAQSMSGMALLRVSDTGGGIPPDKLEQLFEPFFTTKASGGGLGLSILQTIVLRHGGSVSVESEPGRGATFTVTLPLGGPAEKGDGLQ
ncbi:integral membrane sensor signal transduction histidine kinase [Geobacter metallireducens RCH3]|uniref:histidine kinase n=1 Tax=Geobacter metallireducens (strain ATCC 53774 / DSM 7210 / GS-15) TaxID=269799 RepID=Q39TP9_GEOMG|nr:ATP-binding protein [Geobacter metallireducens]ABB32375.1 sensor histidine kinase [Geobacter metallireducens GS-15]EHP86735.1 integral membrane sensor signal transduction histidine kinase [Geobacter metallireducens RCH3]